MKRKSSSSNITDYLESYGAFTHTLGWDGMGCAGNRMYFNSHIELPAQLIPSQRVCECTIRVGFTL